MNDYLNEYLKTCDTINEMIIAKWPDSIIDNEYRPGIQKEYRSGVSPDINAIIWAEINAPELYKQEEKLDARINVIWQNTIDFDDFKKTVIDWARTILKIYKNFSESIEAGSMLSESASRLGGPEVTPKPEP
ncbi:MAG: hypothetical protein GY774_16385 [Planctomycetes bacterium]|nr:hypothetical protein [Planctomycetota bacterium]